MLPLLLTLGIALGAIAVAAYAAAQLRRAGREARYGRLVAVDAGPGPSVPLRSERYRLAGRPDEVRARRDGRWIPVEWKTRDAPRNGPLPSHRLQLLAYCLLCEERTGLPPPYGVLRYGDGTEFRVPWNAAARRELLEVRAALDRPYDGRATPSPGKCGGCRWRSICDARAV